jgi:hypothetical protein
MEKAKHIIHNPLAWVETYCVKGSPEPRHTQTVTLYSSVSEFLGSGRAPPHLDAFALASRSRCLKVISQSNTLGINPYMSRGRGW